MFKKHTEANEVLQKANEVLELAIKLLNKLETYDAQIKHLVKRLDKLDEERFATVDLPFGTIKEQKNQPVKVEQNKPVTLKALRENKKLSQRKVAEKIGVHQSTYWGYEAGSYKPSFTVCAKLAELFGCKVKDIQNALKATADEAYFNTLNSKGDK